MHICNPVRSNSDGLYICLACKAVFRPDGRKPNGELKFKYIPGERQARREKFKVYLGPDGSKFTKDKDRAIAERNVRDYWK